MDPTCCVFSLGTLNWVFVSSSVRTKERCVQEWNRVQSGDISGRTVSCVSLEMNGHVVYLFQIFSLSSLLFFLSVNNGRVFPRREILPPETVHRNNPGTLNIP